ncbi:hypothetical protein J2S53_002482 [Actinopolyspora lacussalsi]|uniref:DUF5319 domain-containing protein n=1 Tax=Actinopolyspora righensis TaxID=995060 RepID=A0A1I7B2L5_9ACTN|nr:DUF5319 domain-containing protein [Actinopolyspora righensis]MDP9642537.1 hypothetical protein [Actinopolyspora lacussalsi]SFT81372.1 hypothetical protein SAMN04487904_10943 [Actinopolyspora righensis]
MVSRADYQRFPGHGSAGLDATGTVRVVPHDPLPPDPFAGDPEDPSMALGDQEFEQDQQLGDEERAELLSDLADLAVYQALLEPRGIRGIVVDCSDCGEPHYHDWELLRSSLEQLLNDGRMRPHEPAYEPNPGHYVSWEYCRGFADGVIETEDQRSR